ncbi:MAG TPA: general secretion pathway protein GspB [Desulfobacterales bacterium]|nr:general secretion pathway protein GspB [Desulfobacterales bacterium]HUT43613.1 general secretion pathway protein GspB [Desulfobacterales bacterium]
MSSILKALKKLENQAEDQNHVRFWRPKNHTQNDGHEQINGHLRFKKRYVIIFAGFVFAVGAGLILSQKLHEKKPELITKKEDILQKPFRLPEKKAAMPDKVQKELSSRKDVKKIEPIAQAAKAAPPSAHKSRGNTAVLFNQKTSPQQQARKETVAGKPSEKPGQNTKADRFASMPVKRSNQTKIEVQAIAWSNDPKSRLAVINGLILREGESVDNVIVMHIGKDAVVFKKGEEGWKQMFGF